MNRALLCMALLAACTEEPPEFRVTGDFSGGINDDCLCGVDHQLSFDVDCDGGATPSLYIDAPNPGQQVTQHVLVFFMPDGVGTSTLAGYADVVAVYPGGEKMFDGYSGTYRPFQIISADAPDQRPCDPLDPMVCADVPGFKIRNATFNCEESVF